MATLSDVLTSIQNLVVAFNGVNDGITSQVPHFTSGQMVASTLILPGFVRVTGISVVTAGSAGGLYDAQSIAAATADTQVYAVPATAGFLPVQMVFTRGVVYIPGAGQVAAVFYAKT